MDFDGVLSPIVDDPAASRLIDGAAPALERLVAQLDVVALLSGRPVGFLAERASVPGLVLLGSYGLERRVNGATLVLPEVEPWLPKVAEAAQLLVEMFADTTGIHVERKSVAVAVHWRRANDPDSAGRRVMDAAARVAAQTGLQLEPGKLVQELRPPLSVDKGTALRRLISERQLSKVAYAGDDLGDLPAFAAVRAAGGFALVVHGAETAPEVSAVPGSHFDGPAEFVSWLVALNLALS
jgi:trehalose 6-phosphate phosphatase